MWRNVADFFRVTARRQNVLKPDARLNSEECSKQVSCSEFGEFGIFPAEKPFHKCKYFAKKYEEKKERHKRKEKLEDCKPNWESSLVGALGWSSVLVLGWWASQPLNWQSLLRKKHKRHLDVDRYKHRPLLDLVVPRYAISQPLSTQCTRPVLSPAPVALVTAGGSGDDASTSAAAPYGPITAEQAVDEAADKLAEAQNQVLGAVENSKGVRLMKAGKHKKAVLFFKRASAFQNARAAYNLGICCEKGLGTALSLQEAAQWYELASSRGHPGAMYNLGVFYARGLGELAMDRDKARQLFESAAELGQQDAARALDKLRRSSKADDAESLYKVLGVESPAAHKQTDVKAVPLSEVMLQALSVVQQSRQPRLEDGDCRLRIGTAHPVNLCRSQMLGGLPSAVYANYIRA